MVIRLGYFASALVVTLAAFASFIAVTAPTALFDAVTAALRWLAAPLLEGFGGYRIADDGGTTHRDQGEPLDPALLNSLRHEAGMRPLRC